MKACIKYHLPGPFAIKLKIFESAAEHWCATLLWHKRPCRCVSAFLGKRICTCTPAPSQMHPHTHTHTHTDTHAHTLKSVCRDTQAHLTPQLMSKPTPPGETTASGSFMSKAATAATAKAGDMWPFCTCQIQALQPGTQPQPKQETLDHFE